MTYPVYFTSAAMRDIEEIHAWIWEHDSKANADYVLDRLNSAAESIAELPFRGSRPRELPLAMEEDFRQVFFKPYRVIYQIRQADVIIHLIADGRRNLKSRLVRRLTGN